MTDPKVTAYLEALKTADPQGFSRPPGLGNIWRNKHITSGLKRGVIVIHHTGQGLAFRFPGYPPRSGDSHPRPGDHRCCDDCSRTRGAHCTHCTCALCIWEREAAETDSPPVSPERVRLLGARLQAFQVQPRKRSVPGLLDDD